MNGMITHYGLFWSERDVFWEGHKGNPGQLLGRVRTPLGRRGAPTRAERNNAEDFRDYVGVYCLYGDGELLYIGKAGLEGKQTLFDRLKSHRRGPLSGRWDKFSWFGRERYKKRKRKTEIGIALHQLEAISIAIVNPGFNRQSGTFKKAAQVFQVPHEDAEGDIETRLERIQELLQAKK